ncbi:hypothetical protein AWB83_00135 [Caballeronia ptereochthonis]|uniref:Uncharacterized protein n=1 Tax=Caballeronia ptereochthonis TaxID=1777144 RepID=A0A157Z357_9BURK|nr:hypothetical protein AWB83_00135 [Caballeronia ptereochthonis]
MTGTFSGPDPHTLRCLKREMPLYRFMRSLSSGLAGMRRRSNIGKGHGRLPQAARSFSLHASTVPAMTGSLMYARTPRRTLVSQTSAYCSAERFPELKANCLPSTFGLGRRSLGPTPHCNADCLVKLFGWNTARGLNRDALRDGTEETRQSADVGMLWQFPPLTSTFQTLSNHLNARFADFAQNSSHLPGFLASSKGSLHQQAALRRAFCALKRCQGSKESF